MQSDDVDKDHYCATITSIKYGNSLFAYNINGQLTKQRHKIYFGLNRRRIGFIISGCGDMVCLPNLASADEVLDLLVLLLCDEVIVCRHKIELLTQTTRQKNCILSHKHFVGQTYCKTIFVRRRMMLRHIELHMKDTR